jgi:hypothetical protein
MKKHALLIITVVTVGLTGALLLHAEGSTSSSRHSISPRHREPANLARPNDPPLDQAARRWLRGEPKHWRDCMLQQQ